MKILAVTARSVTAEIENSSPYFSPQKYTVYLNGSAVKEEERNVFSLFGLQPDAVYELEVNGEKVRFKTDEESALFNVKDFNAYGDGNRLSARKGHSVRSTRHVFFNARILKKRHYAVAGRRSDSFG